jgi:hypothetical protein
MSDTDPNAAPKRRYWTPWHIAAVLLGFVIAGVIFRYTGDADFMLAAGTGAGVGGLAWLLAHFHLSQPRNL